MPLDLLVFGPHPDDIEIGLGGTIARHTSAGHSVGLVDLTEGELSTNGTLGERRTEAREAARVLGAAFRENLGWPDGGIAETPDMVRAAVETGIAAPKQHPKRRSAHPSAPPSGLRSAAAARAALPISA